MEYNKKIDKTTLILNNKDKLTIKEYINAKVLDSLVQGESNTPLSIISEKPEVDTKVGPLQVKFEPHSIERFTACYNSYTNTIRLSPKIANLRELSDQMIELILRHEKSHAIFASLPKDSQAEIVEVFLHHPEDLKNTYKTLRKVGYPSDYFSLARSDYILHFGTLLNRGMKIQKPISVKDSDIDPAEQIADASIIVDELLSWINSYSLLNASSNDGKKSPDILSTLSPSELEILSKYGFLNITAHDLLFQLQQDPDYQDFRNN